MTVTPDFLEIAVDIVQKGAREPRYPVTHSSNPSRIISTIIHESLKKDRNGYEYIVSPPIILSSGTSNRHHMEAAMVCMLSSIVLA